MVEIKNLSTWFDPSMRGGQAQIYEIMFDRLDFKRLYLVRKSQQRWRILMAYRSRN
jgi:hypothetical protein